MNDARDVQILKDSIMAEVRRLIAGKFHPIDDSNHTGNASQIANGTVVKPAQDVTQLNLSLLSTKDSLAKTNITINNLQSQVGILKESLDHIKTSLDNSTVGKSLASMDSKITILTRQSDPEGFRKSIGILDQSVATLVNRLQAIEGVVQSLKVQPILDRLTSLEAGYKSQPVTSTNNTPTSNTTALTSLDSKVAVLSKQFEQTVQGVKSQVDELTRQIKSLSSVNPTAITNTFDPSALQQAVDDINVKIAQLVAAEKFDPTSLIQRVTALEVNANATTKPIVITASPNTTPTNVMTQPPLITTSAATTNPLVTFSPFGVTNGSVTSAAISTGPASNNEHTALLKRLEDLEALVKILQARPVPVPYDDTDIKGSLRAVSEAENNDRISINVLAQQGATKADVDAAANAFKMLESRIIALEAKQTGPGLGVMSILKQ